MKKSILILSILLSIFFSGCLNSNQSETKLSEETIISSSKSLNCANDSELGKLEFKEEEKRATAFNAFIALVGTDSWKNVTILPQPISMTDYGTFSFGVYSTVPASLQSVTIAGYSLKSDVRSNGFSPYSSGGYVYYYYVSTSIMKSKLRPILNHPFTVTMSNGVSSKTSTVYISLGY